MTQAARTYNHAYTIAFSVSGSRCEDGEDVTAQQMADALKLRVDDLMAKGTSCMLSGRPMIPSVNKTESVDLDIIQAPRFAWNIRRKNHVSCNYRL